MRANEAAPRRGNCNGASRVAETHSIVANEDTFRMTVLSVMFAIAIFMVPTIMAVAKAGGAW